MAKNITKKQTQARKAVRKAQKEEQSNNKAKFIIPVVLSAIQFIASAALIFSLKKLNLLQGWQLCLTSIVLLALEALTIYKLVFSKKAHKATKIAIIILSILISLVAVT